MAAPATTDCERSSGLSRYRPPQELLDRRLMQCPEPLAGSEHLGSRFGVTGQRRMLGPGPGDRRTDASRVIGLSFA